MRTHLQIIMAGICLVAIMTALPGNSFAKAMWGQTTGLVSAQVIRSNSGSGVAVRSGPSSGSRVMGHLSPGARVQGFSRFANGYMNLKQPYRSGWIPVGSLTLLGSTAQVIGVDQPETDSVAYGETNGYSPTIYEDEPVLTYGYTYPRTYYSSSFYSPFLFKSFGRHHSHRHFNSGALVSRSGAVAVRAGGVGVRVGNGGVSVRVGRGRR